MGEEQRSSACIGRRYKNVLWKRKKANLDVHYEVIDEVDETHVTVTLEVEQAEISWEVPQNLEDVMDKIVRKNRHVATYLWQLKGFQLATYACM